MGIEKTSLKHLAYKKPLLPSRNNKLKERTKRKGLQRGLRSIPLSLKHVSTQPINTPTSETRVTHSLHTINRRHQG